MKKIISILLLVAFSISLIACAGGETPADTDATDTTITDTTVADTTEAPKVETPAKPDPVVGEAEKMALLTRDSEMSLLAFSQARASHLAVLSLVRRQLATVSATTLTKCSRQTVSHSKAREL